MKHNITEDIINLFNHGLKKVDGCNSILAQCSFSNDILSIQNTAYDLKNKTIKILAFGKASYRMALGIVEVLGSKINSGLVITHLSPEENKQINTNIEIIYSSHPHISEKSLIAGKRVLQFCSELKEDDILISLISGGGSAMIVAPVEGISFDEKSNFINELIKQGIGEREVNIVRKSLSQIKGGKLLNIIKSKQIINLIMSDEREHQIEAIASGPLVINQFKLTALDILNSVKISSNEKILSILQKNVLPTHTVSRIDTFIVSKRENLISSIQECYKNHNFDILQIGEPIFNTEYKKNIEYFRNKIEELNKTTSTNKISLFLTCGELPVLAKKNSKGGRNQHLVLALVEMLDKLSEFSFVAISSDGQDYIEGIQGAFYDSHVKEEKLNLKLDEMEFIESTNSYEYHSKLNTLIKGKKTGTNVSDFFFLAIKGS